MIDRSVKDNALSTFREQFFDEKTQIKSAIKGLTYKMDWLLNHPDASRREQGVIMHGKTMLIADLELQIKQLQEKLNEL